MLDRADIVHLSLPVGLEHGDIVEFQDHVGMFLEGFLGGVLIVLRGHADDDAALFELLDPHLELGEGLADAQSVSQLDAFQTVVTDDTAPNCVVEVEDETLLELSLRCAYNVHDAAGHIGQGIEAEHHLGTGIHIRCEHQVASQLVLKGGDVADEEVGILLREIHQSHVQLAHLIGEG